MPNDTTWQKWLERLYNLRRDKTGTYERPHKPVLLLAILDLFDRNILTRNEIPLSKALVAVFKRYFAVVRHGSDQPSIENPFYFLAGDGFWNVRPNAGGSPLYEPGNASRAPSITALREAQGRFDPDFYRTFFELPLARHRLREALVDRYFPDQRERLAAITAEGCPTTPPGELREDIPGRDAAFRTTILELYDHTCAACGFRVKLQDGFSLMDAAHIIPFGISRNDRPDNGLALCPNHHRAMDANLIAPCPHPEHKAGIWRLSSRLDERRDSQKDLVNLLGKPVLEPGEEKFLPDRKSLDWREQQLRVKY